MLWLAVAAGGAIGSVARYLVSVALARPMAAAGFPAATFLVNVIGCFAIGLLAGVAAGPRGLAEPARAFLVVGLLGGFTTFSSFGLETVHLLRGGQAGLALVNVAGQLLLGLVAVWAGLAAAPRG